MKLMNKKKYKGVKWISTRFSKHYRARLMLAKIASMHALVSGHSMISAIRFSNAHKAAKGRAIARAAVDTIGAVSNILSGVRVKVNTTGMILEGPLSGAKIEGMWPSGPISIVND